MNKIIFLSTRYLSETDLIRFGVNSYLKHNISIEVWYLDKLVNRDYKTKKFRLKKRIKVRKILTSTQLENQVKKNISNCLYDLRLAYHIQNKGIFQLLSKYKINYSIQVRSPVELYRDNFKLRNYFKYLFKKITTGKFFHLKNVLLNKIFLMFDPNFWNINKARYVYLVGKYAYLNRNKHKLIDENTRLILSQHKNYDDYLRVNKKKYKRKEKKVLFIDQGTPYHPDLTELGLSDINSDEYYFSVKKFLEKLKEEFGFKIEISCHPKFEPRKLKKYFPDFIIKSGDTINQIRCSKLIINHASTAMNFAVIYKKPIIFITNNSLNSSAHPFYEVINTMAALLDKECINIDNNSSIDIAKYLKINKKAYSDYYKNFIKFKGPNKLQAEIIIKKLKRDRFWI